jgi:YesN/AraC family two-component response regulator
MEMGIEQDILSDIMDIDPSQNEMFRQQMAIVFDKISLQKNAPTEGAFNEILHDLHENYGDVNLSLERVAQRAGLSKAYVSRLFKLKTGKRYIDYLTDIRMKETMKLLVNTKLSVREITQKVGYYDVASFQKKFKMLYGLSPAKYRDAHGNNLIDDDTPSSVNGNRHPAGISKKL